MNDRAWVEDRVARLISTFSEGAPTDVDPLAMARLAAAAGARERVAWPAFGPRLTGPAWILILVALLTALVWGVLVSGGHFSRRPPVDGLTLGPVVPPFVGIAPDWAEPSQSEDVDLLVAFNARILNRAIGHYWFWLFSDGRIVWLSEGGNHGRAPRGALVEQRLMPAGVDALRSWVVANSDPVAGRVTWAGVEFTGGAGVMWGGLTVDVDGRRTVATWTDATLPQRLVDPASWLPASAWDDATVRGYVPSRYAVCTWVDGVGIEPGLAVQFTLPQHLVAALQAVDLVVAPGKAGEPACRAVEADVARAIFAVLPADRLEAAGDVGPRFHLVRTDRSGPGDPVGVIRRITLDISPVVPSGDVVCNCG